MNIFFLDKDPTQCARWMVDKHVVKMIVETAQLLSTAHRVLDGTEGLIHFDRPVFMRDPENRRKFFLDVNGNRIQTGTKPASKKHWFLYDQRENVIYSATHRNHPSAVWCRESVENYNWTVDHLYALGSEYTYRYGKQHATIQKLGFEIQNPPYALQKWDWTTPPACMPDHCKVNDDVYESYRYYYKHEKAHLHSWKNRPVPNWINND